MVKTGCPLLDHDFITFNISYSALSFTLIEHFQLPANHEQVQSKILRKEHPHPIAGLLYEKATVTNRKLPPTPKMESLLLRHPRPRSEEER